MSCFHLPSATCPFCDTRDCPRLAITEEKITLARVRAKIAELQNLQNLQDNP